MNPLSAPVAGESLADAGGRIRTAVPIRGERATDEDCRNRRELIDDTLRARGTHSGERVWHTAQLADGRVVGVWANSPEEAELDLTVWWGVRCHWVVPDPGGRLREEYFPRGKRPNAADGFPLGPPRPLSDGFAPTAPLFDALCAATTSARSTRR